MAAKKASTPASRAKSRVASRAKGQARAAASKTSAKQDRAAAGRAYSKPGKISESGAGWGNVARQAATGFDKWKRASQARSDREWLAGGGPARNQQREAGRTAEARKQAQMGQPYRKPRSRP